MKTIKYLLLISITAQYINAQSINIATGSTIDVGLGSDLCAGEYGNITGNLIGEGSECGTPISTQTFSLSVLLEDGWNVVSVPGINPDGMGVSDWWSGHIGTVYKFIPSSGYSGITITTPGEGYWMKQVGNNIYNTGDEWPAGGIEFVNHDSMNVASGWNIFGGYEDVLDATALTTTPPGQIVFPIYKSVPGTGYQIATQIVPGYGYWVKVSSACQINIFDAMAKGNVKAAEYFNDNWGRIILTDATGSSYTLYTVKGEVELNQYQLPPLPPAGVFDVRYSSGRLAEDLNSSVKTIDMSGVTYPVKVKIENIDVSLQDVTGKEINTNVKSGEEITISNPSINKLMVSGELLPDKYVLEQNYPNPFNPNTMIRFSIPNEVQVNLSVYNVLGEKVKVLKNEIMKPGYYQVEFDASTIASGVYVYRIKTGGFIETKKMLLIK